MSSIPRFLQKIDENLLVNHPEIWATRILYVLAASIGLSVVAVLLALVYPLNLQNELPYLPSTWTSAGTLMLLPLLFWAYKALQNQPDRQFGSEVPYLTLKLTLIYGLGILSLAAVPCVYIHVLNERIAHLVPTDELIQDVNHLNLGCSYLENYAREGLDAVEYDLPESVCAGKCWTKTDIMMKVEAMKGETHLHLPVIERFVKLATKYGEHEQKSATEIWETYVRYKVRKDSTLANYSNYMSRTNIQRIASAKAHQDSIYTPSSWAWYGIVIVWVLSCFLLVLAMGWRVAVISGLSIFVLSIVFTISTLGVSESSVGAGLIFLALLWLSVLAIALNSKSKTLGSIALALIQTTAPFVPLWCCAFIDIGLKINIFSNIRAYNYGFMMNYIVFTSVLLMLGVWLWIVAKRLRFLNSLPSDK